MVIPLFQVRSLGSLAAEARVSTPGDRLDLFTLDFLEEWTALHASIAWKQVLSHGMDEFLVCFAVWACSWGSYGSCVLAVHQFVTSALL